MQKIRVGVLRGGPSHEYDVSLQSGSSVLQSLDEEKYTPHDILITKDGVWHSRGIPIEPEIALKRLDVAFNALHGTYGEDGEVQKLLEMFKMPHTGSGTLASAVSMNKLLTKKAVKAVDVKVPRYEIIEISDNLKDRTLEVFRTFPQPTVIKPLTNGSSVGVTLARGYEAFAKGIAEAFEYSPKVLIEEYIKGREATCGVVENFRDEELYSLLPVEIVPPESSSFFNYEAKYSGSSKEICPAEFSKDIAERLQLISKKVHSELNLRQYSRSDFIVSPKGIYFLEVNSLPGLTKESLLPKSLSAVGCQFSDFIDHLITDALERKN